MCSCSAPKLSNTLWYSANPSTLEGKSAEVVNVLCFLNEKDFLIKTGVANKDGLIVEPAYSSYGTYAISGKSLSDGIDISLTTDIQVTGVKKNFKGIITEKGMILTSSDSIAQIYKYYNPEKK